MVADSWELVGIALLALGYDFNSEDPTQLDAAGNLLLSQRGFVSRYGYPNLSEESSLVSGETVAATMYSGDALALKDVDPRITYVVPEEGTFLWCDYLTVATASSDPKLALAFIDFLHDRNRTHTHAWEARVGAHSGPVIAGIVGAVSAASRPWSSW